MSLRSRSTALPAAALLPLVAAVVLAILAVAGPQAARSPGRDAAAPAAATVSLTGYGADTCTAPSESQMKAFWNNTPFSYWGVYIGGADRGCSQPNLTSTWVSHMLTTGWDLLPVWVGPQNPCTPGQAAYFSTNTTTAYSQGKAQALAAYAAWKKLSSVANVPIDYDLEASGTDSTTCRNAAKAFVNGWVTQLHVAPAQKAGLYSSSCAGYLSDFRYIAHYPDFIDAADWDNSASVGGISCVPSNYWWNHQRHKQYRGGHNATYNGVTLNIDSRCSDGPVYGAASRTSSTQACARTAKSSAAAAQLETAQAAPVSWHGALWQAGGPLDSQLQRTTASTGSTAGSQPQRWSPVRVGALPVRTHDVAPSAAVVGRPVVLADGALLVPVTEHAGARATQTMYTTTDGTHFTRRAGLALSGTPAPGVAPATTALSGNRVLVVDPNARAATVWGAGHSSRFSVRGLPAGTQAVRTAGSDRSLTALAQPATCRSKATCTEQPVVYRTADGGRTWQR